MRIKICGICDAEQGRAIAQLGATALGFICVPQSPRYQTPAQIGAIAAQLPASIARLGVFVQADLPTITATVAQGLTGVQLHGGESPAFCRHLRAALPDCEITVALRVRSQADLDRAADYADCADWLLLDAYHPHLYGGTGQTLDWASLQAFRPPQPWLLAGGLTPDNVLTALAQVQPDGLDLSSGVERAPGDKDLGRVAQLFQALAHQSPTTTTEAP